MKKKVEHDTFAMLLEEAIHGSIMGIRLGDSMDLLHKRLGSPDAYGCVGDFVIYHPVEFSFNRNKANKEIIMIYVEIPDEIFITHESYCNSKPSVDPELLVAIVGQAKICFDQKTKRVLSFETYVGIE